jgi:hypothetical protein
LYSSSNVGAGRKTKLAGRVANIGGKNGEDNILVVKHEENPNLVEISFDVSVILKCI